METKGVAGIKGKRSGKGKQRRKRSHVTGRK